MLFTFNKHPQAPLYTDPLQANLYIKQISQEIASGNLSTTSEELRQLIRQAGFTNLYFFLKYLAGHSGPYDALNQELHLDICNYRQSPLCMDPGVRFAGFLPRGALKSTILTHGSAGWEALRNPEIRILIINSIEERAYDFCKLAFETFRNNEMVAWLYPEYVIDSKSAKMILPNRKKQAAEDTFNFKGFSGKMEGTHVHLAIFDDVVGMEDLDSNMQSSVGMEKAKRKFVTASNALLIKPKQDRVGLVGTRYSIDDVYDIPLKDCHTVAGYQDGTIKPTEKGTWSVYYRKWRENGHSIDPETYDESRIEKLRLIDPWYVASQLNNDPREGSTLDFYNHNVFESILDRREDGYWLIRTGFGLDPNPPGEVRLDKCFLAVGVDFAATSTGIKASTSKSALMLFAMDGEGYIYLVAEEGGYLEMDEVIKTLFKLNRKFEGYINTNILESNAMQKGLIPLIRNMAIQEELYFRYEPVPVSVPKDVRIRTAVGPPLAQKKLYVCQGQGKLFMEEKDVFPQSEYRKDFLDAAAKAISALRKPWSEEEVDELEAEEEESRNRIVSKAGY